MAIDDNTIYGLYGSQIKDLPEKIKAVEGLARELTTADYNWPENDPDGIALWKLPKGMYYTGPNVKKYISTSRSVESSRTILIGAQNDTNSAIYLLADGSSSPYKFMERYIVNYTTGTEGAIYTYALTDKDIVDNLTSTDTTKALSANQGKVLKDSIDSLAIRGAGAPTTSTVGQVGTLYEDTTNGDLYICTDATNPYVWEEVGAGGGGTINYVSTADYDYPSGTSTSLALWSLDPGVYEATENMSVSYNTTDSADALSQGSAFIVLRDNGSSRTTIIRQKNSTGAPSFWLTNPGTGYKVAGETVLGGPTVVQSTGNSESDIMSQKATTWMVYNGGNSAKVQIGANSGAPQNWSVAILGATSQENTIAIGNAASATAKGAIALGVGSNASTQGVFDVGLSNTSSSIQSTNGYNGSAYRLLTGLYDPQSDHDAATKSYVDNSLLGKQDALTAGSGISIADESGSLVISTTVAEPDEFTSSEWNALWS